MLSMCKLLRQRLTQKWSRCLQVLVLFGRLGCGIGLADAMCGVLACGLARLPVTALGTMVAGTTRRVAVGTTAADTGAEIKGLQTRGKFFSDLPFLSDTIR